MDVGSSTNQSSFFDEYVLEYYLKVQLLNDSAYQLVKVNGLPSIPSVPEISTKTLHLNIGSRDAILIKQFAEVLTNLSQFQGFTLHPSTKQSLLSFYGRYNAELRKMEVIQMLNLFDKTIGHEKARSPEIYYIRRIQIIDMLLLLKASESQRQKISSRRASILKEVYLPLPDITDSKLKETICKCFKIETGYLNEKISELKYQVSAEDVILLLQSRNESLLGEYQNRDFASDESYKSWNERVNALNSSLIAKFQKKVLPENSNQHRFKYVPNDIPKVISYLKQIMFKSGVVFYESFFRCLELWQVDPFEVYLSMLRDILKEPLNMSFASKSYGLAFSTMTIQLEFKHWPVSRKQELTILNDQIFNKYKPFLMESIDHFFDDKKSFTQALKMIEGSGLSDTVFQVVATEFKKALEIRLNNHLKQQMEVTGIKNVINLLALVTLDFDQIDNWCIQNRELNKLFHIYTISKDYMSEPIVSYIENFIFSLHNSKIEISDPKSDLGISSLLNILVKLRNKLNLKLAYEDLLISDLCKLVNNWESEILTQCRRATDDDNYLRLDGCPYSSSVQNVLQICNAYSGILKSFEWQNEEHLATLYSSLYRSISFALKDYSNKMFTKVTKDLNSSKSLNFEGETCTYLNNITKVVQYLDEFDDEDLQKYSKILRSKHQMSLKSPRKFVSVNIKSAENVEDKNGEPVSLYVVISGVISGRTRCIFREYNPEWDEEFQKLTNKDLGYLKIDVLNDTGELYKTLNYRFNVRDNELPIEKRLNLEPNSGSLNISIMIEAEQNDPLFYISRSKMEISKGKDRSIKLFVDKFSSSLKDIFTRIHLEQSVRNSPVRPFELNYKNLKDPQINAYIDHMRVHTIDGLYDNLETECFDDVVLQLWLQILKYAENLALPRISFLFHRIQTRLNRRASAITGFMTNNSSTRFRKTTDLELTRITEWCYMFRGMFSIPGKTLEKPLVQPFEEFQKIFTLYQLSIGDLKLEYTSLWGYLNKVLMKKYVIGVMKLDPDFDRLTREKELILRILLAKNESKFVRRSIEIEQRYERAIRTEMEYHYSLNGV